MENLFFLVVAAILLAVSVYFLISYLKDRKKTKLTFNKRKWLGPFRITIRLR
ncbi:small membrane protein [Klebsiella pneumoniae]|uniref:small membrane protein n=1 Tax=Klebsiella pneumoniae TaxID=573 RepID=UPI00191B2B0C|nr:small membrane protein [Klebsiella pneumoniae]